MSDDFGEIRPKTVPLTHSAKRPTIVHPWVRQLTRRTGWFALFGLAVLAIGLVFFVVPQWVDPTQVDDNQVAPSSEAPATSPSSIKQAPQLPPYQALLRQQAREQAQNELARFVELQLQLEKQMQVGEWGVAAYESAQTIATAGDERFLKEDFDAAIASYQAASDALAALIETGKGLFDAAMILGSQALDDRQEAIAAQEFSKAITIRPNDVDAQRGKRRTELLPLISQLMRRAKNHQLAGEFEDALRVYEKVEALDPATFSLNVAIAETRQSHLSDRIKQHLSAGFKALDEDRLQAARAAFNKALELDRGNTVALGGVEQVTEQTTNRKIDELRRQGLAAERTEDWQTATALYSSVLEIDHNLQFARDGRTRASAQKTAIAGLTNITAEPQKLSSTELFAQAQMLVTQSQALTPRGPKLTALLDRVTVLIEAHRHPVAVTIVSDNLTQVTLSTVGKLGSFDRKQVNLRPGTYTLVGSRDGCRDVRQNIIVSRDMIPIDIRCLERL